MSKCDMCENLYEFIIIQRGINNKCVLHRFGLEEVLIQSLILMSRIMHDACDTTQGLMWLTKSFNSFNLFKLLVE